MEPMLVNLADGGGGAYLRAGITLRVTDAAEKNGAKKGRKGSREQESKDAEAAVRDTALAVLGRQTSEESVGSRRQREVEG